MKQFCAELPSGKVVKISLEQYDTLVKDHKWFHRVHTPSQAVVFSPKAGVYKAQERSRVALYGH